MLSGAVVQGVPDNLRQAVPQEIIQNNIPAKWTTAFGVDGYDKLVSFIHICECLFVIEINIIPD